MKSEVRSKTQSYIYIIYFYDTFMTFFKCKNISGGQYGHAKDNNKTM